MLVIATCNIQDSSFKDEHLGHLEYNGYEGHWWMPNKDPKDLHLDSQICTLGFEGENRRKVIQFTSIFMLLTQGIISLQWAIASVTIPK